MLDYLEIFRKLNEAEVEYSVAGGMAVNLHGIPRMTYDIDLVLEMNDDNLRAFAELVKSWGFKPKVPVDVMDLAVSEKREDWIRNKHMKAFNLVNPSWAISEIDVLIDLPISHGEVLEHSSTFVLDGVAVRTVSIEHLIKMKEEAGRAQDLADVNHLKRIRKIDR